MIEFFYKHNKKRINRYKDLEKKMHREKYHIYIYSIALKIILHICETIKTESPRKMILKQKVVEEPRKGKFASRGTNIEACWKKKIIS